MPYPLFFAALQRRLYIGGPDAAAPSQVDMFARLILVERSCVWHAEFFSIDSHV